VTDQPRKLAESGARTTTYIPAWAAQLIREAREDIAEIKPWFVHSLADQLGAAQAEIEQLRRDQATQSTRLGQFADGSADLDADYQEARRRLTEAEADRDALRVEVAAFKTRPPGCRCDLWPRGYCRQGCPSENAGVDVEKLRRIQAELRRSQEREFALIGERKSLLDRLERQAKWLAWPQYGQIGSAAALRRALVEACDIGLSWSGSDTADGRRLRDLKDLAPRSNEDLAQMEAAREQTPAVGPYKAGDP